MKIIKQYIAAIASVLVLIIFGFIGANYLDPDFGWHFKMGELILKSGIPETDPFSYSMPSFPFVDHEWLTNIGFFLLYNQIGYLGIVIVASLLALSAVLIATPNQHRKWQLLPLLLCPAVMIEMIGARPQVITWFLFAILIKLIFEGSNWSRWRYFVPLLTLIWVNLHGGFAIGVVTLVFFVTLKQIINRKIDWVDLIILGCSILTTFINPYGYLIWGEVWQQISDNSLRWTILEWRPIFFTYNLPFLVFTTLSAMLIYKYKTKLSPIHIGLSICILIGAISSQRHAPLFLIVTIPLLCQSIDFFWQEVGQNKLKQIRFWKSYNFLLGFSVFLLLANFFLNLNAIKHMKEGKFYPTQAVSFINNQLPQGQVFAPYNWGGYLIWRMPDKKIFIDGRMPSWRRPIAPDNESLWAFQEYQDAIDQKTDLETFFQKYDIELILWTLPTSTPVSSSGIQPFILKPLINLAETIFPNSQPVKKGFSAKIKELGWIEVYKDDSAVVYRRSDLP